MIQCEYCKRYFKNKHGLSIHLARCWVHRVYLLSNSTRKQVASLHVVTPDNRKIECERMYYLNHKYYPYLTKELINEEELNKLPDDFEKYWVDLEDKPLVFEVFVPKKFPKVNKSGKKN